MPENLNDTAATGKQHQTYLNNREDPGGKPYSRRQNEANERTVGRSMRYNEDNPTRGVVFEAHDLARAEEEGWVDAPLIHPNCPNVKPKPKVEEKVEEKNPELKVLWDEVDRLNIYPRPHGKTGIEKLRKIVAKAADG